MSALGRARRLAADVLVLCVVPAIVAVLSWRAGFALLGFLARRSPTFRRESALALRSAEGALGAVGDPAAFEARFRLILWIERSDTLLAASRGPGWWRRRVRVEGAWPASGAPCLLLTFHWGAGFWIWRVLADRGFPAWFLARRHSARDIGSTRLAHAFGRFKASRVERIGGLGWLHTGGASDHIRAAWQRGESVLGMLDLPPRAEQGAAEVELLGRTVRFPDGLARLAAEAGVDVAILSCGLDFDDGSRVLRIETLPRGCDTETIMARYAAHLDARLRDAPEAWILWHEAPAILGARFASPVAAR